MGQRKTCLYPMSQQLSLSGRPKTLDGLVGQEKTVKAIRGHMKSGRPPKAWLFTGPKGVGKTSLSYILALSYQCTHQEKFGVPCKTCRADLSSFSINEVNCAGVSTKEDIRAEFAGAGYGLLGNSRYRVYILDECHMMSRGAQNLCLKYLEEYTPPTTVFILCSTEPHQIIETLRSRCQIYRLNELDTDNTAKLVTRLLKLADSKLPADRLTDALADNHVGSPRLIAMATEKYIAGLDPEDAAQVEGAAEVDVQALTRAVVKGAWLDVAKLLKDAQSDNVRAIRRGMLAYLKTVLLDSAEIGARSQQVAKAMMALASVQNAEDVVIAAALASALHDVTAIFAEYKL